MTIFKPVIHNLTKDDKGFKEAQAYNAIIGTKQSWLKDCYTLHDKIIAERDWKSACRDALGKLENALKG